MNTLVYVVNIAVGVAIAGPLGVVWGFLGAWIGLKIYNASIKD